MRDVILMERPGGAEVLEFRSTATPEAGPDDLVVDVGACGVNFIDVYQRKGMYSIPLPAVLGMEGAGKVASVGAAVSQFTVGDRVAWGFTTGSYATQAVIPARDAVPVPDEVPDRTAAALMLQGMTAHFLVHSVTPLAKGDVALVHAGAGGVGLLLTQLLVDRGLRVISTVSSAQKADLSRGAGAEPLVGYDGFADRVRDLTDGRGVRVVFDGVGQQTFDNSLDALAVRGTMVLFGASSGPVEPLDPQVLNRKGSLTLTRPSLAHFVADRAELQWRSSDVFELVRSGRLELHIGAEFPLAEAADAHRALEGRRTTGKVLLIP